jgi:DNA polymerase-1
MATGGESSEAEDEMGYPGLGEGGILDPDEVLASLHSAAVEGRASGASPYAAFAHRTKAPAARSRSSAATSATVAAPAGPVTYATRKLEIERLIAEQRSREAEAAEAKGDAPAAPKEKEKAREAEAWPAARTFAVDNTEGYVEPGKSKPLAKRDMTLVGLGMPPVERTAAGWPAASAAVLRALAGKVEGSKPVYGTAFDYFGGEVEGRAACEALHSLYTVSTIDTMLSNFIVPLQLMADRESRVHCSLNLNTETGRLSARRPSLQNQPALEKDRYGVRKAFMAKPGHRLIVADYGQLELRLLAHLSDCASMIDAFAAGGDFHSRTAMGMFAHVREAVDGGEVLLEWDEAAGPAPKPLLKNVFGTERRKAKVLNFSLAYGKTALGLSKDWNVSLAEAKETLEAWYSDRPEVRRWQRTVLEDARRDHVARTILGRYRNLPDIASSNITERRHAERAAINTPIQGSAADVAMLAMLKLWRNERLQQLGWRMLLQVHDEVILEGPEESAPEALPLVIADMQRPFGSDLRVALVVDAKVAPSWYEAK